MDYILITAQRLCTEQGIEKLNFSILAENCGIARTTLYKYFPDKESILWGIQHRTLCKLGETLKKRATDEKLTTLERFALYFDELLKYFQYNPDTLLFLDVFGKIYQSETLKPKSQIYERTFRSGDFGSRDTVRFFTENFADESIRPDLDPGLTTVSITYSALYLLIGLSKDSRPLFIKYNVQSVTIARFMLSSLLCSISADGRPPKGWEG
jgi:AcrR family transcriptional regulator